MLDTMVAYRSIIRLSETREVEEINSVCVDVLSELIDGEFAMYMVQDGGRCTQFILVSDTNPFGQKVDNVLGLFNAQSKSTKGIFCGDIRPIHPSRPRNT